MSFVFIITGAVVSLSLMLATRQHPPTLIVWIFVVWVTGPYAVFLLLHRLCMKWRTPIQTAFYSASIAAITLSILGYTRDVLWPPQTTPAFIWTLVPPVLGATVVLATAVAALAVRSRK